MTEIDEATAPFVEAEIKEHQVALPFAKWSRLASSAGQCCWFLCGNRSCVASLSNSQRSSSFKTSRSCACTVFRPRVSLFCDPGADPIERRPVLHDNRR